MEPLVYGLCAVTSLFAAFLLLRAYRRSRMPLLFWSGVAFIFFTAANFLLILDLVILPDVNLAVLRASVNLLGISALVYGLVWEVK